MFSLFAVQSRFGHRSSRIDRKGFSDERFRGSLLRPSGYAGQAGFWVQGSRFWVQGPRFRVQRFGGSAVQGSAKPPAEPDSSLLATRNS